MTVNWFFPHIGQQANNKS